MSTISREVIRHGGRKLYRAHAADSAAYFAARLKRRTPKIERVPALKEIVVAKLSLQWSPQQISNWLRLEYPYEKAMQISHESIYTYHLLASPGASSKKELIDHLRQHRKLRENRKGKAKEDGRGRISHRQRGQIMISISERPAEVADRTVPGHWGV